MKKIIVLDGHSIIHRAFYGVPELVTATGIPTNAIFGFSNMLLKLINDYKPNGIFAAFDLHAPTFRHQMYEGYKAGRSKTPEALLEQIDRIKDLLPKMGVNVVCAEGFEADDILGTLSKQANDANIEALLVTGDKDSFQLIGPGTAVLYTRRGVTDTIYYDENQFQQTYGFSPEQFVDYKAILGDKSDNIPGIPGIGEKGAGDLITTFGSLTEIYDNLDKVQSPSLRKKLLAGKESAQMSKILAEIKRDAPVTLPAIPDVPFAILPTEELCSALRELELNKILKAIQPKQEQIAFTSSDWIDLDNIIAFNLSDEFQGIKTLSIFDEGVEPFGTKGCILCTDTGNVYVTSKSPWELYADIAAILEDASVEKCMQDVKKAMHICAQQGISLKNASFDFTIAAYLLDPVNFRRDIEYLAAHYTEGAFEGNLRKLCHLKEGMEAALKQSDMLDLYQNMEHPLIEVLFDMEQQGFRVDIPLLEELEKEYQIRLENLSAEIYQYAGKTFNINSTKQLAEVLFEDLKLPPVKKTKTGYSTSVEVLEQLHDEHPIIEKIMEHRVLSKLKSTYVEGLTAAADHNHKVHTTFNQAVTNTGRLSSTEPNLQNIPIRTDIGRELRRAFLASSEDRILVDADYSQIELRVFADMSGDPTFLNAFVHGDDIHRRTAADVFGVSYEEVTDQMRSQSKAVNFGIIYGISDFGLSKNLRISRAAAKELIDHYMARYTKVQEYMHSSIAFAREKGYSITKFGRRRPCPDIHSRNYTIRSMAERIAVNMPVQGTAADIIKLAMIDVYRKLKEGGFRSKLILQVHDELVIDAAKDEAEAVKALLKESMENVVQLKVPLIADVGCGENWGDAK